MEMLAVAVIALAAFAVVLIPLLRRGVPSAADQREFAVDEDVATQAASVRAGAAAERAAEPAANGDAIEREVLRYREALRAGTLCARCGQANPPDSAYCSDCGTRLPLADAREFD
jgi:hypothetical protein